MSAVYIVLLRGHIGTAKQCSPSAEPLPFSPLLRAARTVSSQEDCEHRTRVR